MTKNKIMKKGELNVVKNNGTKILDYSKNLAQYANISFKCISYNTLHNSKKRRQKS
jgi:hypothetical protein